MTRKYQVFISSSFIDLKEQRKALIMATLREGHIPFGMEMFTPGATRSLDVIEKKISESDIFVVLVGARLGTRTKDKSNSLAFTEKEYELAIHHKVPIIAFLLNEDEYEVARNKIPSGHPERNTDDQLLDFRSRVTKVDGGSRIVGFFSYGDLGDLCDQYSRAIAKTIVGIEEGGPKGGWVSGNDFDHLNNRIHLDRSVSDNPFFRDLAKHLNRFDKLSLRTSIATHLKEGAASYFWQRYFAKLHEKKINALYFESGSSIAYVSRAFIDEIRRQSWWYARGMNDKVRILTNNILTYLDFLLQESPWQPMDVRLNPPGPVSDDYGGTFGKLNFAVPEAPPSPNDLLRTALPTETEKLVRTVKDDLEKELTNNALVLMTASGVDTRNQKETPSPGPHVGSYPNMLLKRSLLYLACPKVLFLHPDKWDFDFRFNNCHAVCDKDFPWERVKVSSPLAIAIAADSQSRQQQLAEKLQQDGFTEIELEEPQVGNQGPWSVIAANQRFADFFAVTRRENGE